MQTNLNKVETLKFIIQVYGENEQHVVAMEECAELIKAISKLLRAVDCEEILDATQNLIEEIADVEIMLEQLKMINNCEGLVKVAKEEKIQRTYDRIREAVNNG